MFLARRRTSPVAVRTWPEETFIELERMALATSLKLSPNRRMEASDNSMVTSSFRVPNKSTIET